MDSCSQYYFNTAVPCRLGEAARLDGTDQVGRCKTSVGAENKNSALWGSCCLQSWAGPLEQPATEY
ncbi:hypothetical protein DAPPUDRAFT_261641 [Daphnia pulex]|uniref:Uncharacterized protein n=1 Tax=Daphnia pulex TaxID=6669 RepID=E9HLC8_DAPPU|nr:hypothetical protein DAPPUDRAFT_261641 [Daphnia pulex]|eukprot:EFX67452.1 hypothetical protein DAPPUDRAFT_261641 [Daphnia pulex]